MCQRKKEGIMFKKRWSHANLLCLLAATQTFSLLAYCSLTGYVFKKEKEKYAAFLEKGSEVYVGVGLPNNLLDSDKEENCRRAKAFLFNKRDEDVWRFFHSEEVNGYKVFIFKVSFP